MYNAIHHPEYIERMHHVTNLAARDKTISRICYKGQTILQKAYCFEWNGMRYMQLSQVKESIDFITQ